MMNSLLKLAKERGLIADGQPVALTVQGEVNWQGLQQKIEYWQDKVEPFADKYIAVYHEDGVEYLAILLALWRLSRVAVVPANKLEPTLRQVAEIAPLFVGDIADDAIQRQTGISSNTHSIEFANDAALVLYTSGSSGQPEPIVKTFRQLNAELEMLEQQFGGMVSGALIVGTVSHHHMYGLPFRLLWPLLSGRLFLAHELNYFEQLKGWQQDYEIVLITSPAHLQNIPGSVDFGSGKPIKAIFSAGAELLKNVAERVYDRTGRQVTEIYGSTETGAVAWRRQQEQSQWQALPGVAFGVQKETGQLKIKGPSVCGEHWFLAADCCSLINDCQFVLEGRVDKVIKVGGKRISLTAIERALCNHPWVDQVKLVLLRQRKSRLGAVIVLNSEGRSALVDQGKLMTNRVLLEGIKGQVEPVGLPRYWRYVAKLPTNNQGKVTLADLEELFDQDRQPKYPSITDDSLDEAGAHLLTLDIPENLFYFAGHFPGNAILPGVVQTAWAIHYGQEKFGSLGDFVKLENLKFQRVIKPGVGVILGLTFDAEKQKLYFSYKSGDTVHSSGRVVFKKGESDA